MPPKKKEKQAQKPHSSDPNTLSQFLKAVASGSYSFATWLDKRKCHVDDHDATSGYTALLVAAQHGHDFIVEELLSKYKADVNKPHRDGSSAATAVIQGTKVTPDKKAKILATLVKHRIILQVSDLMLAILNGNYVLGEQLLALGLDVNSKDKTTGSTALLIAIANKHRVAICWLFAHGADPHIANNLGMTPHKLALSKGLDLKTLGYSPQEADEKKLTEADLFEAAKFGKLQIVEHCVKQGMHVNHTNFEGDTALMLAAVGDRFEVVDYLLENKADIDQQDQGDLPVVVTIAAMGSAKMLQHFLAKGAQITPGKIASAILYVGIRRGDVDIVKTLLDWEVRPGVPILDIDSINYSGVTPLVAAILKGDLAITALLLEYFPTQISRTDSYRNTPLVSACREGCLEIVALLLAKGGSWNIDQQNILGTTALASAVEYGKDELISVLLEADASIDLPNHHGESPLMRAVYKNNFVAAKILLSKRAHPKKTDIFGISVENLVKNASVEMQTVFKFYENQDVLSKVLGEQLPVHNEMAGFFQEENFLISLSSENEGCLKIISSIHKDEDENACDVTLSQSELKELCDACAAVPEAKMGRKIYGFLTTKQAPDLEKQAKHLEKNKISKIKSATHQLTEIEKTQLRVVQNIQEKLKESQDNFSNPILAAGERGKKIEKHIQKNENKKKKYDGLLVLLGEKKDELRACIENIRVSGDDILLARCDGLVEEFRQLILALYDIDEFFQGQLNIQQRWINEWARKKKSTSVDAQAEERVSPQDGSSEEEDEPEPLPLRAPKTFSVPRPKMAQRLAVEEKNEEKPRLNSVQNYPKDSFFYHPRPPALRSIAKETQIAEAIQARHALLGVREIVRQSMQTQRPLPEHILVNALLGACAQAMENFKHVKSGLNPFYADECRHFRNVIYHGQALFEIRSDKKEADISMQQKSIQMALELVQCVAKSRNAGNRTRETMTSTLYLAIQAHELEMPSYDFCIAQIKQGEQELGHCEQLLRLDSEGETHLLIESAQQFSIAKIGAYVAKIRDCYPDESEPILNTHGGYLSPANDIRHSGKVGFRPVA